MPEALQETEIERWLLVAEDRHEHEKGQKEQAQGAEGRVHDRADMGVPTVVSTFAGCGGSSLGYVWAGFRELLAIEWDAHAAECFRSNFRDVPVWERDIRGVTANEVLDFCGIAPNDLDVLDGSPPCQGFSTAGKRRVTDPRNDLSMEFVRLIGGIRPKAFVMENVSGMAKGKMKGRFKEVTGALRLNGDYTVRCRLMNAMNHGVPQSRSRLVWIGFREDIDTKLIDFFQWPSPRKSVCAMHAILDIVVRDSEIVKPRGIARVYSRIMAPGKTMADYHPMGNGYGLRKLDPYKPCYTVTKTFRDSQAGLLHWDGNRFLTISELKRLCSFPDDFKLTGKFDRQWAVLGNAVMPRFMEAVALQVRGSLGYDAPEADRKEGRKDTG